MIKAYRQAIDKEIVSTERDRVSIFFYNNIRYSNINQVLQIATWAFKSVDIIYKDRDKDKTAGKRVVKVIISYMLL